MVGSVIVFAYNFPHRKTQDFLLRLFLEGIRVSHVLAADPVRLNIPESTIRTKIRHTGLVPPRIVAERIGADYHVVRHNDAETVRFLSGIKPELGIVAGARILKRAVIDCFGKGIINFHPGLIPEARGLDALLWSIAGDIPVGVTAHLIDEHVDAGIILLKEAISVHHDDTVFDLSERLYECQLDMLKPAIDVALKGGGELIDPTTPYNRKMPSQLERETLAALPAYVARHAARWTKVK